LKTPTTTLHQTHRPHHLHMQSINHTQMLKCIRRTNWYAWCYSWIDTCQARIKSKDVL